MLNHRGLKRNNSARRLANILIRMIERGSGADGLQNRLRLVIGRIRDFNTLAIESDWHRSLILNANRLQRFRGLAHDAILHVLRRLTERGALEKSKRFLFEDGFGEKFFFVVIGRVREYVLTGREKFDA